MRLNFLKKIITLLTLSFFCSLNIIFLLPQSANAQTIRQLKRDLGLLPRTAEKKRRSEQEVKRQNDFIVDGFRIHQGFNCETNKNISGFDIQDISERSIIDTTNLNDPQTFALAIQMIKAHLNIALRMYFIKGIDLELEKYPVRYHADSELDAYPQEIALEPDEPMKIFFPDTLRSLAYVRYVIIPNFVEHILPKYYTLLNRLMRIVTFEDVLSGKKKRTIWTYQEYKKYIDTVKLLIDKIEIDFLNKSKINQKSLSFRQDIISAILLHHWISYLALRSCGFVPYPEDPLYDANLYYDATPARDNYFMGMGIFEQFKQEFNQYKLYHNEQSSEKIDNYINFFDNFYKNNIENPKDIEPPETDNLPFDKIKKLHIDAVCSFQDLAIEKCYPLVEKQLLELENSN